MVKVLPCKREYLSRPGEAKWYFLNIPCKVTKINFSEEVFPGALAGLVVSTSVLYLDLISGFFLSSLREVFVFDLPGRKRY